MKTFRLYLSFLKTFLKSGVKLNLSVLLISTAALLSFVSIISFLKSTGADILAVGKPVYEIVFDGNVNSDTAVFLKNEMPQIIMENDSYGKRLLYYSEDRAVKCEETYVTEFPEIWNDTFLYLNKRYTIYDGRDFTEEEKKEEKGVIIVSCDSLRKVGEEIVLPLADGDITLTIIGISDSFILPFSYIEKYGDRFREKISEYSYTTYAYLPSYKMVFERELDADEYKLLQEKIPQLHSQTNEIDAISGTVVYATYSIGVMIVAVFSAIQIYTLFLYLASKASYQTAVCEICGCFDSTASAIILLVIATYILIAFAVGAALMPPFTEFSRSCHLNYMPTFFDFILSFAIYVVIIISAVLPGVKRISNAPLVKEVNR